MSETLKIGVVGCGSMGANHARIASDIDGSELVGVVDADAGRGGAVADATGAWAFATVEALLEHGIDAAVVATPTVHHHAVAALLLRAGVHVLVEKPLAGTVEEANALVALAGVCRRVLTVGHVERFNPAVLALRKAVPSEEVRRIAITRAGPFPARIGDVGIVLDLGVHDIDLIRWIAGSDVVESHALVSATLGPHEDSAALQFRTQSGVVASIDTNWLTPFRRRRLEVATRDRFLVCDMLLRTVVEHFDFGKDGSFRQRSLFVGQTEPLKAEHMAFHAAIRGEAPVAVSGSDGARALEIALGCLARG